MADISISSSPPFPPPVRRVIFAFSKSVGGESVSEEDLFGQGYLVSLDRYHQLVAIVFVGVNPRLGFSGFFLQRCRVSS